jgi:hypothetical protein
MKQCRREMKQRARSIRLPRQFAEQDVRAPGLIDWMLRRRRKRATKI